jgi:GAF domain-containing protein
MGDEETPGGALVRLFGGLAMDMQEANPGEATLQVIVAAAVKMIPGVRWAGISTIQGRDVIPMVPTSDTVAELDAAQSAANDGPCLTALRDHERVHIEDMATDGRWPAFASAALQRGVHSLLSFQLFVFGENLGALNLYADEPHSFDRESILIGDVLAQHASVAMAGAAAEMQFDEALSSRDLIGQAKGILMHRASVDAQQAFTMLQEVSQATNTKLAKIAELVVADHVEALKPKRR